MNWPTSSAASAKDQFQAPTPCADYDVEQLRDHMVGWLAAVAAGFAAPDGQAPRVLAGQYAGRRRTSAQAAADVRAAVGALAGGLRDAAAGRPLRIGDSATPVDIALGMILLEYQVHGWDLARATGQHWSAAQASLAFAPAMLTDDYQGDGKPFGKPAQVPPGHRRWTA
ncbi:MAG: TIGR03086 family metal-binding protein [Streptosporangiaceae bacterium]